MYKFLPIVKTLVWGTERWVLSAVPGNESTVADGPCKGKTIDDIFPGQFPLLIKFIDAHKDLSIQVHPDDALAAERHGCNGKTEMWYITGAEPGARLLSGLNRSIGPQEYERLVREDRITEVLSSYEVAPGDVFFLPAGRIHAIGAGCRLAEIQQTSDITYRIYDYNRPGLDGKPRPLHTQEAKDAIDYSVLDDYRTHYSKSPGEEVALADCKYFRTNLLETSEERLCEVGGDFLIAICLSGSAYLNGTPIKEGEAALALSSEEKSVEIRPQGRSEFLIVR